MNKNQVDKKAYILFALSMFIFGTSGVLRRYIPLGSNMICFARGCMGAFFIVIYTKLTKKKLFEPLPKKSLWAIILAGAMMGLDWMVLFEAYNYTSVPIATLCFYMQPTILILLSPIFFKEKLGIKKLLCAAAAVIGMILVSGLADGGSISARDTKGILLALLAALGYAIVSIMNKKTVVENDIERTVIQLLSAATVMIPCIFIAKESFNFELGTKGMIALLLMGLLNTGISYVLYFTNVGKLKMQSIAILGYMDPITALFLSAIFLGEKLSLLGILGAIMIIAAAIISEKVDA